jgi:hypothetical protein
LYDFDWSGRPIPQDVKDFLRALRSQITTMDEAKRRQVYDVIGKIMELAAKK